MIKLLLLSLLIETILVPTMAARSRDPARGLRSSLMRMSACVVFYWLVVMFLTPRP